MKKGVKKAKKLLEIKKEDFQIAIEAMKIAKSRESDRVTFLDLEAAKVVIQNRKRM